MTRQAGTLLSVCSYPNAKYGHTTWQPMCVYAPPRTIHKCRNLRRKMKHFMFITLSHKSRWVLAVASSQVLLSLAGGMKPNGAQCALNTMPRSRKTNLCVQRVCQAVHNYRMCSRNLHTFFFYLGRLKIGVRKICGFFLWRSLSGFYSSIIENTVRFVNILL
jgi:hypothetical protein